MGIYVIVFFILSYKWIKVWLTYTKLRAKAVSGSGVPQGWFLVTRDIWLATGFLCGFV